MPSHLQYGRSSAATCDLPRLAGSPRLAYHGLPPLMVRTPRIEYRHNGMSYSARSAVPPARWKRARARPMFFQLWLSSPSSRAMNYARFRECRTSRSDQVLHDKCRHGDQKERWSCITVQPGVHHSGVEKRRDRRVAGKMRVYRYSCPWSST